MRITRAADEQLGFRHPGCPSGTISRSASSPRRSRVETASHRARAPSRSAPARSTAPRPERAAPREWPCCTPRVCSRPEIGSSAARPSTRSSTAASKPRCPSATGQGSCRRSRDAPGSRDAPAPARPRRPVAGRLPLVRHLADAKALSPLRTALRRETTDESMSSAAMRRIQVIDSHTGGEPTRVVIAGGPDLGRGRWPSAASGSGASSIAFRSAVVNEPRGSDVIVGALLVRAGGRAPARPASSSSTTSAILGMCGHGTIGLVATLAHLGRIAARRASDRDARRDRHRDAASRRRGLGRQRRRAIATRKR